MTWHQTKIRAVTALCAPAALLVGGGCASGTLDDAQTGTNRSELVAANYAGFRFWANGDIPICFLNHGTSTMAARLKSTLLETWAAAANLKLTFYDSCANGGPPAGSDHIEITFKPSGTWAVAGGFGAGAGAPNLGTIGYCDPTFDQDGDGVPQVSDCNDWNAADKRICNPCSMPGGKCSPDTASCICSAGTGRLRDCSLAVEAERSMVVHEFGHALGFMHEQQNPFRPANILEWCPWVAEPTATQPPAGPATETGDECNDGADNDSDGAIDCGTDATHPAGAHPPDPDCDAICRWWGWMGNNGIAGQTYTCPYNGQSYPVLGLSLTRWDPLSATTYCPDTDGILDWNNDGKIEVGIDDELADIADAGKLSASNVAAVQLVYGIKGQSISAAGNLYASAGFEVGDQWLVTSDGTLTARWRTDGLLDSAFLSPTWKRSGLSVGTGVELAVSQLTANASQSVELRFTDFRGRARVANQSVERSSAKHAGIVLSLM